MLLDSGANSKLRNNQGLKKNNSQYLSIECINCRELGRHESIKFFIFLGKIKHLFLARKKGVFNPPPLSLPRNKFFPNINLMSQNSLIWATFLFGSEERKLGLMSNVWTFKTDLNAQ